MSVKNHNHPLLTIYIIKTLLHYCLHYVTFLPQESLAQEFKHPNNFTAYFRYFLEDQSSFLQKISNNLFHPKTLGTSHPNTPAMFYVPILN